MLNLSNFFIICILLAASLENAEKRDCYGFCADVQ